MVQSKMKRRTFMKAIAAAISAPAALLKAKPESWLRTEKEVAALRAKKAIVSPLGEWVDESEYKKYLKEMDK